MRRIALVTLTVAMTLGGASAAQAQKPDCVTSAYDQSVVCQAAETAVLGTSEVRDGAVAGTDLTSNSGGATLPFTGAELSGIVLAGALLVGGGTTLVVAGRRRKQQPTV